ncbi:hypothetical protein NSMS1_02540 [Nostoc sp. MS1]|nr:hypothetical protein NSMS1_02540 [Nostoc sp. MS1]
MYNQNAKYLATKQSFTEQKKVLYLLWVFGILCRFFRATYRQNIKFLVKFKTEIVLNFVEKSLG